MAAESPKDPETPLGQLALYQSLGMSGPLPFVQSCLVAGARRTRETESRQEERYPAEYRTDGTPLGHLRFALRHEPLDLRIVVTAFRAIGEEALSAWVRAEPTGAHSRRAWFLYETLTGRTLDLPAVRTGNYVDALDAKLHFVARPVNSPRHRVRDNLLGTGDLCPAVRRTARLEEMVAQRLDERARTLTAHYDPETLARAVSFLYTKETRSSFAIEGETPTPNREERFLQALQGAANFDPASKGALLRLQGTIVDPRYAAADYRDFQNFVGETTRRYGERVHFICPRPEDVPALMRGWAELTRRLDSDPLDPVVAAALSAFTFVFIHPFEDGNGRIHRFLIHSVLSRRGYTPEGMIFPVSASILRDRRRYDAALEAFSKPALLATEWTFAESGEVRVQNNTGDLYRFVDATPQVEYLYERVKDTIDVDLKEELDWLVVYEEAFRRVRSVVDMPDRRASLLIRLCLQNQGRLSQTKRPQFAELTDDEIARIEEELQRAMLQA
jgi:hypothetical protein